MQHLEVSGAVRSLQSSLSVKALNSAPDGGGVSVQHPPPRAALSRRLSVEKPRCSLKMCVGEPNSWSELCEELQNPCFSLEFEPKTVHPLSGCVAMEIFVRPRCTWAETEVGTQTSIHATNNTETRTPSRSGDWQYCLTRSRVHVSVDRQFIVTFLNDSGKYFKAGHSLTVPQHYVTVTDCPVAALCVVRLSPFRHTIL